MVIKTVCELETINQKDFLDYICGNILPNAFYRLPHSLSLFVVHFDAALSSVILAFGFRLPNRLLFNRLSKKNGSRKLGIGIA